jgi:hypothetical protein
LIAPAQVRGNVPSIFLLFCRISARDVATLAYVLIHALDDLLDLGSRGEAGLL